MQCVSNARFREDLLQLLVKLLFVIKVQHFLAHHHFFILLLCWDIFSTSVGPCKSGHQQATQIGHINGVAMPKGFF